MVVKYNYDAYGRCLVVAGTQADTLGQLNPLRYRGYVYDSETELYYLQSRYYDPEMFDAAGRIWTAFPVKR